MAGFNKVKVNTPNATSYEGGAVYKKSAVDQWLTLLFSSFLEDKFYESAKEQRDRFLELTQAMADEYGYEFVAKAATFARNELGMRSISQLVAAWLNPQSFSRKRAFYSHFMHRPDDVAEIFAAVESDAAYNTVLTVVRILEQKGFVGHETFNRSNRYYPLVTREEYMQQQLGRLTRNYFGSSARALVSFLVDKKEVSLEDLELITKEIES